MGGVGSGHPMHGWGSAGPEGRAVGPAPGWGQAQTGGGDTGGHGYGGMVKRRLFRRGVACTV
jgi:hypothetical protein